MLLDITRKQPLAWDAFMHKSRPRWLLKSMKKWQHKSWKGAKTRILRPPVRGIVQIISADFDTDRCLLTWRESWAKPATVYIVLPGAVTWRNQSSPQNKRTRTWKADCEKCSNYIRWCFYRAIRHVDKNRPPLFSFLHPLTRYLRY